MPVSVTNPVMNSVLRAAREATGASRALLLAIDGEVLTVVAADGDGTATAVGVSVDMGQGVAGFVAASGQPVALRPSSTDQRLDDDVAVALGWQPQAVLTVPCLGMDTISGVLELLDPDRDGGFDFDDVESTTVLAGVAGTVLEEALAAQSVPSPSELHAELTTLADADPGRYATVATLVQALLDRD
ncbi:MAG: GAF domain-containing protein [Acidimicrobiales bacterium]|nr:GAF domain-containing protein [Acidimicrobiales bacterium]